MPCDAHHLIIHPVMVVVLAEQDGRARSDLAPSLLAHYMAMCTVHTTRELSYPAVADIRLQT
jgi:hypothetical protein